MHLLQMGVVLGLVIFFRCGVTKFKFTEIQLLIPNICNLNVSFSQNIKSELDKGVESKAFLVCFFFTLLIKQT